jgi:hypothetical protein
MRSMLVLEGHFKSRPGRGKAQDGVRLKITKNGVSHG